MSNPWDCPEGYEEMTWDEKTMTLVGLRKIQKIDRESLKNEFKDYFNYSEPTDNAFIDDLARRINIHKVCIEKG